VLSSHLFLLVFATSCILQQTRCDAQNLSSRRLRWLFRDYMVNLGYATADAIVPLLPLPDLVSSPYLFKVNTHATSIKHLPANLQNARLNYQIKNYAKTPMPSIFDNLTSNPGQMIPPASPALHASAHSLTAS
jgi:hypothetical protein